MVRSYFQIILVLTFQITTVSTNWVSNKGLWYYISDSEDKRNYTDAVDYCANLDGHLATIVNNVQRNFLIGQINSTKYWIGLSTLHTKHNNNCKDIDMVWADDYTCAIDYVSEQVKTDGVSCSAYTIHKSPKGVTMTVQYCNVQHGFICQWQCHTLGIVSKSMSWITGVYEQQYYKSKRKFYEGSSPGTDSVKSLAYKKVVCDKNNCTKGWEFSYEEEDKLYHIFRNFTPYYQTMWFMYNSNKYNYVHFTCMDCLEYKLSFTNVNMQISTTVQKQSDYHYINDIDPNKPTFSFDHDSAHWCYTHHNKTVFCFIYDITPIGYISIIESVSKYITIECTTVAPHDVNDLDEFTTTSQKTQSVTTSTHLHSNEPGRTRVAESITTHTPEFGSTPAYSIGTGMPTTPETLSNHDSSHIPNVFVSTQNTNLKPSIEDMFSRANGLLVGKEDHLADTKLTTISNLYSQTADPQSDDLQNEEDNLTNSNSNIYIGVGIGVVLLIVFAAIFGVVIHKRRKASKGNTKNATQNLDDVHVITDTNIYSEPSFTEPPISRAPHVPVRNCLSSSTNTTETAPNIPRRNHAKNTTRAATEPGTNADTILQSHSTIGAQSDKALNHGSSTDAHGSSNMPIYSEVNKNKKSVPPVPTEPVYSRVSKKAKSVNCENKQGNIQNGGANGSDSDIEFCDNDVYESERVSQGETQSNTGDISDEEFSDNELYERGTPALA